MWKYKGSRITKGSLKKKSKVTSLIQTSFKIYQKARVIKTVWYWEKKKNWGNRRESRNRLTHKWYN